MQIRNAIARLRFGRTAAVPGRPAAACRNRPGLETFLTLSLSGVPQLPPRAQSRSARAPSFTGRAFFRISDCGCLFGLMFLLAPWLEAADAPDLPERLPPLIPPRGEIPPSFWELYSGWIIVGGVLLVVLLGLGLWLLLRPRPPLLVPPAEVAREELTELREAPEDGWVLSRVSQSLRHYFAAAFGLPQGELTTTEFCQAIASRERIGSELSSELTDFLRECDERKFAPGAFAQPLNAVPKALGLIGRGEARRTALSADAAQTAAGQPNGSPAGLAPDKSQA